MHQGILIRLETIEYMLDLMLAYVRNLKHEYEEDFELMLDGIERSVDETKNNVVREEGLHAEVSADQETP